MSGELVRQDQSLEKAAGNKLYDVLKKYERSVTEVLPAHLNPKRMTWLIVNSIRTTPALAGCTPESFINAVLLASNLGVEIRRNSAYLIPYGKECQLLLDYRAKLGIAQNAGVTVYPPQQVRENDEFEYWWSEAGLHFLHKPKRDGERGEITAIWCMAENALGKRIVHIMTVPEIEAIRKRAKSGMFKDFEKWNKAFRGLKTLAEVREKAAEDLPFNSPYRVPWVTDWDKQAEKTVIHALFNRVPQNDKMALSQEVDAAYETGEKVQAEQMAELMIDPADNVPLIEGGETREEQTVAREAVKTKKLAAAQRPLTDDENRELDRQAAATE